MTKSFILTLFVIMILTACKTESREEQTGKERNQLVYNTAVTTIISWDKNSGYPFDRVNYKAGTLTQEDLRQLDSLFNICISEYNNSLTEGHDDYKIDLKSNDYKRQLVVVINSQGEKELWVNCFCDDWDKPWKTEVLVVHDGGPCYFNFKINLTTKKIYDLGVNGFA